MMEYVVREAVKLASSTAGVSQLSQYKKSQDKSGLPGWGPSLLTDSKQLSWKHYFSAD